jgi:sarcosine oxidase subunit beta
MPNWKKTADVAIVGGGIMGVSSAYHLARRGVRDIVIVEKDLLAQGSTGLSVGGIRQQFSHPSNIQLSQESVRVFERFQELFGLNINFCQAGYLFLARTEETWNDFRASAATQRQLDVPVQLLNPDEIGRQWPYLKISDIVGGTFCAKDGYADPYLVTMGYTATARRLGVRVEESTQVTGFELDGVKASGIITSRGRITAPVIIIAAGPWAGEVGRLAGIDLPVRPYRRQAFMTAPFSGLPRPVPMIIDQDITFYLRGADPGLIMGMSDPREPSTFNLHTDREFMERVVEAAIHRAPVLENARILRGWAGLYEVTPDDNPIIGEIPGRPGLFCAVGFSGHGFQQGPAVGDILAGLIVDGRTGFDLSPFAYDRFTHREEGEKRVV